MLNQINKWSVINKLFFNLKKQNIFSLLKFESLGSQQCVRNINKIIAISKLITLKKITIFQQKITCVQNCANSCTEIWKIFLNIQYQYNHDTENIHILGN